MFLESHYPKVPFNNSVNVFKPTMIRYPGTLSWFEGEKNLSTRLPGGGTQLSTDTCLWKGGGLWIENFQIWGLLNWKFQNSGACELKISKFGGLWAEIWAKIEAVEVSRFSQKGVLWTDPFACRNGTLANCRREVKRGSSWPHIPIPPF